MRVLYDLDHLPTFNKPVLTIGTFDGVHKGHQAILDRIKKSAQACGGESVIITFDPHPRLVLGNHGRIALIQTLQEKIESLRTLGIDNLVVVPFTKEFAALSAEEYIRDFLVNHFHPYQIIIGYDHQFGNNRTGNFSLLDAQKDKYHFLLEEIPMQEIQDSAISSTKIRNAIELGELAIANDYLGRPYSFIGKVVHGDKRGRTIGFPTANLEIENVAKLVPAMGVYAVEINWNNKIYAGMMNIGIRPTVTSSEERRIEVHIFDFEGDLYDHTLNVSCIAKIREEKKFNSLEELIAQLNDDKIKAINLLN